MTTSPISQIPANVPLTIVRGDSWTQQFIFRDQTTNDPINITSWTVTAQIRSSPDDDTTTSLAITNGGSNGTVTVRLTAAQSAALPAVGVWDLQRSASGDVRTLLGGSVKVVPDVTHD